MNNIEILKNAGIDTDDLAERFGGNFDFAMRFMQKFLKDVSFNQLKTALQSGSNDEAVLHAHTLKGVAGNLSMKGLYETAARLEATLRGREQGDKEALFQELSSRYETIIKAISAC